MRYRLLSKQTRSTNNSFSGCDGAYKPVGSVKVADTPEEALRSHSPIPGRWLVLCEDDHTWRIFDVASRTETDIAPADDDAASISTAMV